MAGKHPTGEGDEGSAERVGEEEMTEKMKQYCQHREYIEQLARHKKDKGYPPKRVSISKATLRAKCSRRMVAIARPKRPRPPVKYLTSEQREELEEMFESMTKQEKKDFENSQKEKPKFSSGVRPAALKAVCPERTSKLALARHILITTTKRQYGKKLKLRNRQAVDRTIKTQLDDFARENPPNSEGLGHIVKGFTVHKKCVPKPVFIGPGGKPQTYICELKPKLRTKFQERNKKIARPKPIPSPKEVDRGPKVPMVILEPRLANIAEPRSVYRKDSYNPYAVKKAAMKCVASERTETLANPRAIPPPPPLYDWEGNELPPRKILSYEKMKKVVASARILDLSKPRYVRQKLVEEEPFDPFAVPRAALTYVCSQRMRELAEPRKRD